MMPAGLQLLCCRCTSLPCMHALLLRMHWKRLYSGPGPPNLPIWACLNVTTVSLLCDGSITSHAQHLGHCYAGLETYANYMFGGGYIVSADVAKALVTLESLVKLKFTPIEDATVGFWLMGMDIRQIDHPKCVLAPSVIALQMGGAEIYAKAASSGEVCAVLTDDPYRHCEPSLRRDLSTLSFQTTPCIQNSLPLEMAGCNC